MRIVAFVAAATALATQLASPVQRELENVEAFARLYGVVRYFYPSDAAAALDWNRFAVHGVGQVRRAGDSATLGRTLETLFEPLGPGIVLGTTLPASPTLGAANASLVAWRYDGPGGMGSGAGAYTAGRLNRAGRPTDAFVAMAQSVPAGDYRGKRIRLTARVRVPNPDLMGWAGLWLRVDRPNQQFGFFDNMQNRPIRSSDWREYVIEGLVADDATSIIIGALTNGVLTAEYDAFELSALDGETWVPISLNNAGFEDGGQGPPLGWQRMGTASAPTVIVDTKGAAAGQHFLRLTSSAGAPVPAVKGAAIQNAHVDVDLASGLKARVRLSLTDEEARATAPALKELGQAIASVRDPNGRTDMEVQLADVVVAWNVFRHFYPYWEEAGVDWDARLRAQLALAAVATDRRAHHGALRTLVADVRDGHGGVTDTAAGQKRALLPIQMTIIERQFVITASTVGSDAPIGSVVTAIGQRSTADLFEEGMRLASGTAQWRETRTLRDMVSCATESTVTISLQLAGGQAREVALSCTATQLAAEPRPEPIAQMSSGYWYVDLTRATRAQVAPMLETLGAARGLVFDVRGYPTDAGFFILSHLIDAPESDRWMHVPHITGPFVKVERWQSVGWNLQPATPHLAARRVFLTDRRAISYAESVMGYVADRDLATIVGGPTAGTNGNVATAVLPGGFAISFTGMRVTGHDGSTPFHLRGVTPDVPLQRTLAGIRAGRDELLERALEILGAR